MCSQQNDQWETMYKNLACRQPKNITRKKAVVEDIVKKLKEKLGKPFHNNKRQSTRISWYAN